MIGEPPTLSVSDFVGVFNQSISMAYPEVSIVGELANFRVSKGAWVYFDLKDEFSTLKFFGSIRSLPGPLEEGMMLEVQGRPNLHSQFGFSINFSNISVTGEGSIIKAQNLLVKKLEKEGLFSSERKRSLPYAPRKVIVISSSESAGYGDFKKVALDRWPNLGMHLIDVRVQGKQAINEIIDAVESANLMSGGFDVLIVVRGGGSKDDLALFDDERVARAIAGSRLPTVVAIGHERDISIAEMVADVRASTPTNVAQILVPDAREEKIFLLQSKVYLRSLIKKTFESEVEYCNFSFEKINNLIDAYFVRATEYLKSIKALLTVTDPRMPLKKGYVLVQSGQEYIRSVDKARKAKKFNLEFVDGKINVRVEG